MNSTWEQAARHGDAEQLHALSASVDLNARDRQGQTALMLAAHAGHAAAVRVLLTLGADANHTAKHGLTALMLAVLGGHSDVVQALLDGGADTTPRGRVLPASSIEPRSIWRLRGVTRPWCRCSSAAKAGADALRSAPATP